MQLNIYGLQCDHCEWRDDEVPFSDYESSIGRPCPVCGSNLLTKQVYDNCLKWMRWVGNINKMLSWFRWLNPLYYWRLIFGDHRQEHSVTFKAPKRKC